MQRIQIALKGGVVRDYPNGVTVAQIAESLGRRLAKDAIAALIDGKPVDLDREISHDADVEILTFEDEKGREIFWHSSSHILAQAVKRLFPEVKLAIGPAIDQGFYYDFDRDESFTPEDLEKIEAEMANIVAEDSKYTRQELTRDEATEEYKRLGEIYKEELIEGLSEDEVISFYSQGEFRDLCAGPHIPSTGKVKAFKLMSLAGAYWRGSEDNKMLQRIYGVSFPKKSMLKEHLAMLEEAKKRDHRKLGKELGIFSLLDEGPGFPFFHPKGMVLWNLLTDFWRKEHEKHGYQEIKTPIILSEDLWHRSGHWDHYKDNMYFTKIDHENFAIKPMNCPGGMLVYKTRPHSYRDLPLRVGELGLVHRHELSGALHGLMRVRCFTQDDAHIYMTPSQIEEEVMGVIDMVDYFYDVFGFDYNVELSTRPEDSMGSEELWDKATDALKTALEKRGLPYSVNEGDGAFYGPKIDFHLKDSLNRTWQCGTIQLDFQMPERFDLSYIGPDGERHRPVMIHRVIFGSIERFIGILIEHFAGAFPVWLAPVQAKIIPISEKHMDYAKDVREQLKNAGIRAELDERNEKVGFKIREAQIGKIPYMLIVGDKEEEKGNVSVRVREKGDVGEKSIPNVIEEIVSEDRLK